MPACKKRLTARQRQVAGEIPCGLAGPLGAQGDAQMQALHDAYSPQTLADTQKDAAADRQRMVEEVLGESLGEGDAVFGGVEKLLIAAQQKMRARDMQEEEARAQRAAKKQKSAAQLKKEEIASDHAQNADGALRTLYRQLASALHPDREPDAQQNLQADIAMMQHDLGRVQADDAYFKRWLKEPHPLAQEDYDPLDFFCRNVSA